MTTAYYPFHNRLPFDYALEQLPGGLAAVALWMWRFPVEEIASSFVELNAA